MHLKVNKAANKKDRQRSYDHKMEHKKLNRLLSDLIDVKQTNNKVVLETSSQN